MKAMGWRTVLGQRWAAAVGRCGPARLCAMALLAAGFTSARSQSTGTLRLMVTPDAGMQYVLDHKYRLTDRELTLPEGPHHFVFWAPERRMLDTTVHVKGGAQQELRLQLFHSLEAIAHRDAMDRYTHARRWGRALPPVISAGAAAWTVASFVKWGQRSRELDDLQARYGTLASPTLIARLKHDEIPAAKDHFRQARTMAFVSSGTLVLSAAATWWSWRRVARMQPPVLEDRERIRFEGLVHHWDPIHNRGVWAAHLSIPIR